MDDFQWFFETYYLQIGFLISAVIGWICAKQEETEARTEIIRSQLNKKLPENNEKPD